MYQYCILKNNKDKIKHSTVTKYKEADLTGYVYSHVVNHGLWLPVFVKN